MTGVRDPGVLTGAQDLQYVTIATDHELEKIT